MVAQSERGLRLNYLRDTFAGESTFKLLTNLRKEVTANTQGPLSEVQIDLADEIERRWRIEKDRPHMRLDCQIWESRKNGHGASNNGANGFITKA